MVCVGTCRECRGLLCAYMYRKFTAHCCLHRNNIVSFAFNAFYFVCRIVYRVLVCMLEVFSKFQNPKALYRHQDLHTLYMKVLYMYMIFILYIAHACAFSINSHAYVYLCCLAFFLVFDGGRQHNTLLASHLFLS